jgi:hypothetical protein
MEAAVMVAVGNRLKHGERQNSANCERIFGYNFHKEALNHLCLSSGSMGL